MFWGALSLTAFGWGWLTTNPLSIVGGLGFIGASAAYVHGASVFGKRADGSLPMWSWVAHAPFILAVWSGWWLRCRTRAEPPRNEVVPGVWLGRRPSASEVTTWGLRAVVDLTAELPGVRASSYVALPTMDGTAPTLEHLDEGVRRLHELERPVLVHCLAGHSRSATVLAAWMIDAGFAASVEEAVRRIQASRPAAGPTEGQEERLRRWVELRR